MSSPHSQTFRDFLRDHANPESRPPAGYSGSTHIEHGVRIPILRDYVKQWSVAHQATLTYEAWIALLDDLYRGESLEEKAIAAMLLSRFKAYRTKLDLAQLDTWLGQLEGWAEVDATCQNVFSAQEILSRWDDWQPFLQSLADDENINKRRASLVLLTRAISKSADARLYTLALGFIERLKHEKDNRITKAISWVLRDMLRYHREASSAYVEANADSLPPIAVREYRKKRDTGKK